VSASPHRLVLAPALVLIALAGSPGPARTETAPRGGDEVLLGRVFHRGPGGTLSVARFGLVVRGGTPARLRLDVRAQAGDPATGYLLDLEAQRRRGDVQLGWRIQPAGAAGLGTASGAQRVARGSLGHVAIAQVGSTRIYASVEAGRASSFDAAKLARHFDPRAAPPSAPAPAPALVRPVALAAPSTPATGGRVLLLAFRLDRDGETAFAPRVRVREGETFAVRGGSAVEAGGGRWDGIELAGRARLSATGCLVDLSVQSGRRLDGDEGAWIVDRYRRDVVVPTGRESVMPLFEDLEGEAAGRLSLALTCSAE
jgi:hypothetical protein